MLNDIEHLSAIIQYNDVQIFENNLGTICLPLLIEVSSPHVQLYLLNMFLFTTIPRKHKRRTPSERESVEQRYPTPNTRGSLWHKGCDALVLKLAQSHV